LAAPGLVVTGATQVAWTNTIGHAVVEEVTFKIGGIEFGKYKLELQLLQLQLQLLLELLIKLTFITFLNQNKIRRQTIW
jgi:hypothetical protein